MPGNSLSGAKPTPNHLRIAGARYLPNRAPEAAVAGIPEMPEGIENNPVAAKEFDSLVKQLSARGTITEDDGRAIMAAALAWWLVSESQDEIIDKGISIDGKVGAVVAPAVRVQNAAWERYLKSLRELGLTPAARNRVDRAPEADEELTLEERRMQYSNPHPEENSRIA